MKKKYRVTTRGKIVFSLVGLLLLYGIYFFVQSPKEMEDVAMQSENSQEKEIEVSGETSSEVIEEEPISLEDSDNSQGQIENNVAEQENNEDEMVKELSQLESASFTVYYAPNAYYVPEDQLAQVIAFSKIATQFPEQQIIIEGNVNKSIGPEKEWDTRDVDELGYTRALVIKNDLIDRGVPANQIIIYNNRDEKPLNIDASQKSIALNRRVDVFFSQFMYKEINDK